MVLIVHHFGKGERRSGLLADFEVSHFGVTLWRPATLFTYQEMEARREYFPPISPGIHCKINESWLPYYIRYEKLIRLLERPRQRWGVLRRMVGGAATELAVITGKTGRDELANSMSSMGDRSMSLVEMGRTESLDRCVQFLLVISCLRTQ
jgi:hypothetical protein